MQQLTEPLVKLNANLRCSPGISISGSSLKQHVDQVQVALHGGVVQRHTQLLVSAHEVGPGLNQHMGDLLVVVNGCSMEWSDALIVRSLGCNK